MEWFGWLTKPHMQVSMLDRLIMLGELIAIVIPAILFWAFLEVRKDKRRLKRT